MKPIKEFTNTMERMGYEVIDDGHNQVEVRLVTGKRFGCLYIATYDEIYSNDYLIENVVRSLNKLIIKNL